MDEELLAVLDFEPACDALDVECSSPVRWAGTSSCCGSVVFRCEEHRRSLDARFAAGGFVAECGEVARRVRWDVYGAVEHG